MTYLESLILCFFDAVFVVIIGRKLMSKKPMIDKWGLLLIVLLSFSLSLTSRLVPEELNIYIDSLITFFVFMVYFRISAFKSLMLTLIFSIVAIIVQMLAMVPLILIFGEIEIVFSQGVVAQAAGLIIVTLIYFFIPINVIYEFSIKKNRMIKIIIANIAVLLLVILTYWYLSLESLLENALFIVVVALGLVVLNGVIIRNGLRNEHDKKQLGIYEAYFPVIERLAVDVRKKQHDFNNHLQAISAVVTMNDSIDVIREEVERYGSEIRESQSGNELISLENKIAAGFIYSKLKEINEEGKVLETNIQSSVSFRPLRTYELIEILGILLDNAAEASEKGQVIGLFIFEKDNSLNIITKNRSGYITNKQFNEIFSEGYSSKGEGRGLGLSKLSKIVKRYKGEILVENEENEKQHNHVVFHVVIPQ